VRENLTTLPITYAGVMAAEYAVARQENNVLRFRYRTRGEVVVRAVERFLGSRRVRLLDVGAAAGRSLAYIAQRLGGGRYVGVEYSHELRGSDFDLPDNVKVIAGDAMSLPSSIKPGSRDVVSMLALLEHLDDPQRAVREAARVVATGGIVVATAPNPVWDHWAGRLGLIEAKHHVSRIDSKRLVRLMKNAGLEIIDSGRFMWAPVASLPYLKIPLPPWLGLAVDLVVGRIPLLRRLCVNAFVVGRKVRETEDAP